MQYQGVILTNTRTLALKYREPAAKVISLLDEIIRQERKASRDWLLLDVCSNPRDARGVPTWEYYNERISDFFRQHSIPTGISTSLLIIGGDDVIPMPSLPSPFYVEGYTAEQIPTDFAYCFDARYITSVMNDHIPPVSEEAVRNHVARLPLESGVLFSSIKEDLESFFIRCNQYPSESGLPVDGVTVTTDREWVHATDAIAEGLPLICDGHADNFVYHGMYTSPDLLIHSSQELLNPFLSSIQRSDMLIFNLHGSDRPGHAGFFSHRGVVVDTDMVQASHARVVNTLACFGARFMTYSRKDSMLLSSIYSGRKLLYLGASVPVPMSVSALSRQHSGFGVYRGSGAEKLFQYYNFYLFQGVPAGEALMRAKIDYFHRPCPDEAPSFRFTTLMIMSLFGNPLLRFQPRPDVMDKIGQQLLREQSEQENALDSEEKTQTKSFVSDRPLEDAHSLLSEIQRRVDANLEEFHRTVQRELKQKFGIEAMIVTEVKPKAWAQDAGANAFLCKSPSVWGEIFFAMAEKDGTVNHIITFK